ncbi:hypothetical protein SUGI_1134380 [Cryptomeria japonica]|nr:hypothetical protein SUGI_1134380 [Cryptomeria japonica]
MCGDVGFQIYLFQCTKCLIRFQHQYCSRAYYENVSVDSISELCDWCFTIQEENAGSDVKLRMRGSAKKMRNSVGFEECTNNNKGKRNLRKSCSEIGEQISKLLKKKGRPELSDRMERKNRKRYKLLDEIVC